jgi:hypothetical protein
MSSRTLSALAVLASLALWYPSPATAFVPNDHPHLQIPQRTAPIDLDGELDDAGWRGAARAENWTETWPGDQVQPPVDTEVWVTYDEEHLYLAFLAQDDPATVRATLRDRDEIWQDDYVGIILDTYATSTWAYEIFVNPLGIQGDLRWTTEGEDMGFDLVWDSVGRITDEGWQVEVAVPFKSLRFPDGQSHTWRATFWRNHPRDSRRRYSWAEMDRDEPCWPCNFGTLTGIEGISSGSSWELLPSLTGYDASGLSNSDDPASGLEHINTDVDFSLGARYALSSSFSAQGTYNPDFSQVESDAAQIDVNTTFALFFPEQRPFFQEGSDLYDTWVDQVYTRSINNPQVATKLTGRMGRGSVAYMFAQDEDSPVILPFQEGSAFGLTGKSWSNIVRGRQNFGEDNHLGFLGTDRRLKGGGSGTTLSLDGQLRLFRNYRIEAQVVTSHTAEPEEAGPTSSLDDVLFDDGRHTAVFDGESFWGHAEYVSLERDARRWNFDFDYWAYSPTFRADNGFVTQNDTRRVTGWTAWFFRPDTRLLDEIYPAVGVGRVWNFDGLRKDEWIRPELNFGFKRQTSLSVAWLTSNERFRGPDLRGIKRWQINLNSNFSQPVTVGAYLEAGKIVARRDDPPVLGDARNVSLWGTLRPVDRLVIQPSVDFVKLDRPDGTNVFDGYVTRTRLSFQFTRRFFLRVIVQYDEFDKRMDFEPLLTYRVNPFTVFFLGSRHGSRYLTGPQLHDLEYPDAPSGFYATERQFFAKFQYLFRT